MSIGETEIPEEILDRPVGDLGLLGASLNTLAKIEGNGIETIRDLLECDLDVIVPTREFAPGHILKAREVLVHWRELERKELEFVDWIWSRATSVRHGIDPDTGGPMPPLSRGGTELEKELVHSRVIIGESDRRIAQQLGWNQRRVAHIRRSLGLTANPDDKSLRPSQLAMMRQWWDKMPIATIAERLNVDSKTIRRHADRLGLR